MFGLLFPDEMDTASMIELKEAKNTCDRVISICSFWGCLFVAVSGLLSFFEIVPAVFVEDYGEFLGMIGLALTSVPMLVICIVLRSRPKKYLYIIWALICAFQILLPGWLTVKSMLGMAILSFIQTVYGVHVVLYLLVFVFQGYDKKLKAVKGYPYFDTHKDTIINAAKSLDREKEKVRYARKNVDIEEFYQKPEKKPDPASEHITAGKAAYDKESGDITTDMLDKVNVEDYFRSVSDEAKDKDPDWL